MSRTKRASRAFEAFKGEKPGRVRVSRLPDNDVVGWEMGPMVGVAYEARRDGKTQRYFHEFAKGARPKLVSQDDGRKLYIDGGRYKVTDRGIEDMPGLMVVNPSSRTGRKAKPKGSSMARRRPKARSRRRSNVSIFVPNPRRRSRRRRASARRVYAANPSRRRRARTDRRRSPVARRIYARNPSRRRARSRRLTYRRNPMPGGAVGKLSSLILPAIGIGLGAVGTEIVMGYLPIPAAWKTGNIRYLVKGALGVVIGVGIAKLLKQKRLGYFFAAGAVAIATHDFVKQWMVNNASSIKMGYYNPGSVARFGMYERAMPMTRMGQYARPLRSQFGRLGGDNNIVNARMPGGEMNFAA